MAGNVAFFYFERLDWSRFDSDRDGVDCFAHGSGGLIRRFWAGDCRNFDLYLRHGPSAPGFRSRCFTSFNKMREIFDHFPSGRETGRDFSEVLRKCEGSW
mmetsp:Transcript_63131/g.133266  ORF Transcript_63131/g.133266 Transcript_63131/m.133266 type:complete len:100 (-) Transcript_63131:140-439(-)